MEKLTKEQQISSNMFNGFLAEDLIEKNCLFSIDLEDRYDFPNEEKYEYESIGDYYLVTKKEKAELLKSKILNLNESDFKNFEYLNITDERDTKIYSGIFVEKGNFFNEDLDKREINFREMYFAFKRAKTIK